MFVEYQFVQVPRAIIPNELHQMGSKVVLMNAQASKFQATGWRQSLCHRLRWRRP